MNTYTYILTDIMQYHEIVAKFRGSEYDAIDAFTVIAWERIVDTDGDCMLNILVQDESGDFVPSRFVYQKVLDNLEKFVDEDSDYLLATMYQKKGGNYPPNF